ncbi:exo-alpha-sialidase [Planomonospora corallina]|uniref:exo-alpha-sialidase n=1 Tax=Planomonospora corallina TaxID=1806052 RepID=A0ABV8I305_9ACTN
MKRLLACLTAAGLSLAATPATAHSSASASAGVTAPSATTVSANAATTSASAADPALTVTDLATGNTGGWPVYRIPALTTATDGTLIAAYDGRPSGADLPSNIALLVRRSTDNGKTWTAQQVVRREAAPNGYGDPSLLTDRRTGRIFLFHSATVNQGYFGSHTGNDENDPDVQQADYSYSDDHGVTWKHRRITKMIKNPAWAGLFAASGEGIQLRRGPHAGRLVQQYAVRYNGGNYAASAYSDDHGETWKMGALVGPGADENKTVELSDGTIMLNSRAAPYRKIAYSTDGGVTYTPFAGEPQLADPANNGSIMRYAPDAPASDPRSKWLLFSNTESTSGRQNLTVKMSCDDGRTWPIRKTVEAGSAAYSTLTLLRDGRLGLLYERDNYRHVSFTSFGLDWLPGVCAPLTVTAPPLFTAGGTGTVKVKVTNQTAAPLAAGTVTLAPPGGWTGATATVPQLAAGASTEVSVRVTAPAPATTAAVTMTATYSAGGKQSTGSGTTTLLGGTTALVSTISRTTDGVNAVDISPYLHLVKDLSGGSIAVTFSTTTRGPAASLLSAADPASRVKDLVVSINNGRPYFEVRRDTSDYPVRIATGVDVADGRDHTLVVTSTGSGTRIILDGRQIAQSATQGFFASVPTIANLTLGANRVSGGDRWAFEGTVKRIQVTNG